MGKTFEIYVHPETNAEVVDVVCPKHAKVKGHVAAGQLGTAECGMILKSRKETGPEEIDNGKKVRPTRTVVLDSCHEKLVWDGGGAAKARLKAAGIRPGENTGAQQAAAKIEADEKKAKTGGKASQRAKAAGNKRAAKAKRGLHPQAVS